MTITTTQLAMLALDSYHRGLDSPVLDGELFSDEDGTPLGSATLVATSAGLVLPPSSMG